MNTAFVVIAGVPEPTSALKASLRGHGVEAEVLESVNLPEALVSMESRLEEDRPDAAVAVGTNEDAVALAITAGKTGVPVAAVQLLTGSDPRNNSRVLATLATFDAGPDLERAADLIASWLREGPATSEPRLSA